jgi:hypothetical protein
MTDKIVECKIIGRKTKKKKEVAKRVEAFMNTACRDELLKIVEKHRKIFMDMLMYGFSEYSEQRKEVS